ncbi:MAG: hypothetical protein KatS3mg014_0040 [Actinomycetota bacterium]|nr:MAG: hypothetical protein KatS3mg014_0040 [Actinomycetota bacterium]
MGIGRRAASWTAIALAGVVLVLTALVWFRSTDPPILGPLDRGWRAVALGAPGWAEVASRALKAIGSGAVMVPVRLAVGAVLLARRRYRRLGAWLLGWALADALTSVLKPAIGRLRPDGSEATAFPSGHAKSAAQVAVGLALLARPRRRGLAWAGALPWAGALAWVAAMALSRTVLNEHWLSDVVAGAALGAACALGAWAVVDAGREATPSPGPPGTGGGPPPRAPSPGPGPAPGRAP